MGRGIDEQIGSVLEQLKARCNHQLLVCHVNYRADSVQAVSTGQQLARVQPLTIALAIRRTPAWHGETIGWLIWSALPMNDVKQKLDTRWCGAPRGPSRKCVQPNT